MIFLPRIVINLRENLITPYGHIDYHYGDAPDGWLELTEDNFRFVLTRVYKHLGIEYINVEWENWKWTTGTSPENFP